MADNAPTLPQVLRNEFASAVFPDLSAPERNAAVSKLLSHLDPATPKAVENLAQRVRDKKISPENASEELGAMVIAGQAITASGKTYSKDATKGFVEKVIVKGQQDPGTKLNTLRALAELDDSDKPEPVKTYMRDVSTALHTISPEPESQPETPEPIVVTGTTNNGDTTMDETEFQEVLDKIDSIYAFDESKLPSRLHYDGDNGSRVFSVGQKALISGVILAMKRLNAMPRNDDAAFAAMGAVMGILLLEGRHDPDAAKFFDYVKDAVNELNSAADPNHAEVGNDVFEPDFTLKRDVFAAVAKVLSDDNEIFFDSYASVGRQMVDIHDSVKPNDKGFANAVEARYANETLKLGGGSGGGNGVAYLDLPPLSDPSGGSDDIVKENITAVSSIYVVYQCEQMMLFSATDRIVELFMAGLLPMAGDSTARLLDQYYWNHDKVSVTGRSAQYTRALGAPGGDVGADVSPNSEFNSLLMRVISSISEYERQNSVGNLLDQTGRRAVPTSGEYVRKAVRDLAANCTLYGFAGVQFAAERLQPLACRVGRLLGAQLGLDPAPFLDVVERVLDGFLDHLLHFGIIDLHGGSHLDELLIAGFDVSREHMQNAVGVDLELHAHLGHALGLRLELEREPPQAPVVRRLFTLTLQHVDEHLLLVVGHRRERLAALHWDRRVAWDDHVHQPAERLDTQRERRHVEQQHAAEVAGQNPRLNRRAQRDRLVRILRRVQLRPAGAAPEHSRRKLTHERHPRLSADEDHLVEIAAGQAGVGERLEFLYVLPW